MSDYRYNNRSDECCVETASGNSSNCCSNNTNFREAVCIHTDKIYDSCRE